MPANVFVKRRAQIAVFVVIAALMTVGSVIMTKYDVFKSFTSIYKAFAWGLTNFYPTAASLKDLPDILLKLAQTVLMSIAATTVAAVVSSFLAIFTSRTTRINPAFSIMIRGIASFFRNFPLVAWAMILMLAFSQSQLTGYLALFCGSVGFLTRAFMETIDEVGSSPVEALQATGAGYFPIIFQAVLPSSMPLMTSWLLFTIDTNIRDAILVGFLTGTGIGFAFELYYKSFDYHAASLVTIVCAVAVILLEMISNSIRRVIL